MKTKPAIGLTSRRDIILETGVAVACACMHLQKKYGFGYRDLIYGKGRTEGARNLCCERAIENGNTHLIFVDGDASFPPDLIQKLIDSGKDIIGANAKNSDNVPVLLYDISLQPINYVQSSPVEVDYVGMHITLISLKILEKIPKPWFFAPPRKEGANDIVSEDVAFCRKAREYGFKTYLHPEASYENMHWKTVPLSMLDVVQQQAEEQKKDLRKKGVKI